MHKRRVIFAALNIHSGQLQLDHAARWNQRSFQDHLFNIRSRWRGWRTVLFLDRGSPHTVRYSRALARYLNIELRFLSTATPELNPMDGLWREIERIILSNEPNPDVDHAIGRACEHLEDLSPRERLKKAGVLSKNFWLAT